MAIQQLSVFAENRYGTMLRVVNTLKEAGINLRALNVAESEGYGILRMIVDDAYKAKAILSEEDSIVSLSEVLGIHIPDTPGGLQQVLSVLDEHKINIRYLYAFSVKSGDEACVVLRVRDTEKVESLLASAGIRLVTNEEIAAL